MSIIILIASIRKGRKSDRVAKFFKSYISENKLGEAVLMDLKDYNFPLFEERLKFLKEYPDGLQEFASRIKNAEGIIIVTPEYNGGYPASLKNVVDVLYEEWRGKPVGIVSVSNGMLGGAQVITSLEFTLWKMGVTVVTAMFPVRKVEESYNEEGIPADKENTEKAAQKFMEQFLNTRI